MEYNNIFELEDKINLLYDFIYNINTKNEITIERLTLGKISLDDIKISLCDQTNSIALTEYNQIKSDILNAKFKLILFDKEKNEILLKRYSDQFSILIKLNFYKNENEINSFDSSINNDSLFSYLLSQLVLTKKSKHILLPIVNIDINYNDIKNILLDDSSYILIKKLIDSNAIYNTCCLQIREYFFQIMNLEDYIKELKFKIDFKILLFQVIHTLSIIQHEFSGFRHNNLILRNIYIYKKSVSKKYYEYLGFNNDIFYIPNSQFDIKITNFEFAIIPKFYGIKNNSDDTINSFYDIKLFLNDLKNIFEKNNITIEKNLRIFLDINTLITPNISNIKDLLYNIFFAEYLNKPTNLNNEQNIFSSEYLTGKRIIKNKLNYNIDTIMESDNSLHLGNQKNMIKSNLNIMDKNLNYNNIYHKGNSNTHIVKNNKLETDSNIRIVKNNNNNNIRIVKNNNNIRIIKNKDLVIKGGSKIEASPYKAEKNTPFMSNDQRKTQDSRNRENPPREPPILLEQTIYDTSQKQTARSPFPPTFIPTTDQYGNIDNILPYSNMVNQPPVQKVYNISLTNPLGSYSSINRIYEDVIPGDPTSYTSTTIYERLQLIDFLRNNILEFNDGEEMHLTGNKNSLLSHIKILEVNPYTLVKNPYLDLAQNFILYSAAYPVRFEDQTKSINIAKPSMSINIRIYMMSYGDLNCKKINYINSENFDLWREIKYYDWIKNIIIKRNISPNFITPILYKIDSGSKIDWSKLELIKSKYTHNNPILELRKNQQQINKIHTIKKKWGLLSSFLPIYFREGNKKLQSSQLIKQNKSEDEKEDLTIDSGKILIFLTEAPTTNILQWASSKYNSYGSIKKMISTGYHSPNIWKSILFQLVYACAILEKADILFENFSLENNIFIKDIYSDPNVIGSWIYKIDNLEYYIPNYGYILLVDSKYTDINIDSSLLPKEDTSTQKFKIYGDIFSNNSIYPDATIRKNRIVAQFKEIINPDNFSYIFKIKKGSIPDDSILDLLRKMWNNSDLTTIKDYIHTYFCEYLHNRIGTLLYKSEKENLNMFYRPNFSKCIGNLMAWQKRYQEFEWVIYLKDCPDGLKKEIIIKQDNIYIHTEVFSSTLYSYPENEKILQDVNKQIKYDDFNIYETYNFNNFN